jgi:hypothetical protein
MLPSCGAWRRRSFFLSRPSTNTCIPSKHILAPAASQRKHTHMLVTHLTSLHSHTCACAAPHGTHRRNRHQLRAAPPSWRPFTQEHAKAAHAAVPPKSPCRNRPYLEASAAMNLRPSGCATAGGRPNHPLTRSQNGCPWPAAGELETPAALNGGSVRATHARQI